MDNSKGMAWMVLAMLGFALADMFIKLTLGALPVGQVISFFGIGGMIVFGCWALLRREKLLDPALATTPFLIRFGAEAFATLSFVTALSLIDLSLLSAVIQATPLLVTLGAIMFLGETVGWRRWLAISIGLIGVLIIVRPGTDSFSASTLWAVVATIGLAARDLSTRGIAASVSTLVVATWGFFSVSLAGIALMLIQGGVVLPDPALTGKLVGALICSMVAYYAITAAMRVGEIAVVTPFRYSRLVFALLLAFFVFDERPDLYTLLGAAIVIVTGIFTFWREARALRAGE